jgi:3-oxoadipate enol-lactonase
MSRATLDAPHYVSGAPRIACSVAGHGPPVIFLHGIGGRRQNWRQQCAALQAEFTVIAWDARGYGDSDDVTGPLEFGHFGSDLARLLDDFNIERAHLVGLSMGARILMDFHPRYSARVATLTLCNCFYGFAAALSPAQQREYLKLREQPLREGKTFAELAPTLIASLVSEHCSAAVRAELLQSILALRVDSYLKTLRASVTFDRSAALEHIDVPVQLIFSDADRLTPASIGTDMLAKLPQAKLTVLANAGHLSNLEQADTFNATLQAFLRQYSARARFFTEPADGPR